jgi:ABC-type sugar transport system ATPase subunit
MTPAVPLGLRLRGVVKRYGKAEVLHGIDLDVAEGAFTVFVGPSGCGKSTLLRMIAGLETITDGQIEIGGTLVNDVPPRGRDIAMVFQDYALYPHMNVRENMGFGLRMRGVPKAEAEQRMQRAAAILQIESLLERRPKDLSGGQRQRVAMGRAIVRDPRAFLFDEPLSNLDAKLRAEMRTEIKRLHAQLKATVIYVTHDQVEAMTLADRIVVLNHGRIEQEGTPDEIYNSPRSQFVAAFMGAPPMNLTPVIVQKGRLRLAEGQAEIAVPTRYTSAIGDLDDGAAVVLGIRPEHFSAGPCTGQEPCELTFPVSVVEPLGSDTLVFLRAGDTDIVARVAPGAAPAANRDFTVGFDLAAVHLFSPQTGLNLLSGSRTQTCRESSQ